ncbi:MAG: cobalt ECF transporter T component CbiQ [Candidatus Omnitrophota bacterium]
MKHKYLDEYSSTNSFFCCLDPRVKIVSIFGLVISIILTHNNYFTAFCLYGIITACLIFLSKIPFLFILKRSVVIIPFVLIAALSIPFIKHGRVIWEYHLGALKLTLSYEGVFVFLSILIKAFLSIICMVLLTAGTKFTELLKAFEILKFPKIILMIISFMYRYIFVVQDELMQMLRAKKSRSVQAPVWFNIRVLANMSGSLFIRAYERSEAVYLAMCSRGFNGSIQTSTDFARLRKKDLIFLCVFMILLLSIGIINNLKL